MADLNTSQKAPLIVQTAAGANVPYAPSDISISGTAVHFEEAQGSQAYNYIVADEPGVATVSCTYAGQSGSLVVTVTAAPLSMDLGTPEPK